MKNHRLGEDVWTLVSSIKQANPSVVQGFKKAVSFVIRKQLASKKPMLQDRVIPLEVSVSESESAV